MMIGAQHFDIRESHEHTVASNELAAATNVYAAEPDLTAEQRR
jgi:hypothetical protein